jgi:tetratricopeptide (TPR) repeat protein
MRLLVTTLLVLVSGGYAVMCSARTRVWHNSETLHTDAIEQYPMRALLSYKWRGHHYFSIGEYDKAMQDYEVLVTLRSADNKVKANMEKIAVLSAMKSNLSGGQLQPATGSYKVHLDSAMALVISGDTSAAFRQYVLALASDPVNAERSLAALSDQLVQKRQYARAIAQYNMLMKLNTTNPFYYFLRGCAHFGLGNLPDAVKDWEVAVKMNSKDVQQSASYNLSVAYDSLRDPARAWFYMDMSQKLGYTVAPDYAAKIRRKAGK